MAQAMRQIFLVGKLEVEVDIKAPTEKFYEMYTGRLHDVAEATPRNVQACELDDGEWGTVGSVIVWNYVHDGQTKVAKEIIEEVEPKKWLAMFRVVEGDVMEEFKSFLITIQVTPKKGDRGSLVKLHFDYEKIDENVDHPETLLPFFVEMIKDTDKYLLSEK